MANKNPVIDENTIFADDYVIDGDPNLWPPMWFPYIRWLSPSKILAFTRIGIPFSLLFLFLTMPGGVIYGFPGTIGFLIIWLLASKRLSKIDWALCLTSGAWIKCLDEEGKNMILNSGFLINKATGRVYNKEEEQFVRKYREEHPHWFREDPHVGALPYNDEFHYGYDGFWYTKSDDEEFEKKYKEKREYMGNWASMKQIHKDFYFEHYDEIRTKNRI